MSPLTAFLVKTLLKRQTDRESMTAGFQPDGIGKYLTPKEVFCFKWGEKSGGCYVFHLLGNCHFKLKSQHDAPSLVPNESSLPRQYEYFIALYPFFGNETPLIFFSGCKKNCLSLKKNLSSHLPLQSVLLFRFFLFIISFKKKQKYKKQQPLKDLEKFRAKTCRNISSL